MNTVTKTLSIFAFISLAAVAQATETPQQNLFRNAMSFSLHSGISRPFLRAFQALAGETNCEFSETGYKMKWTSEASTGGLQRDFTIEAICKVKAEQSNSGKQEIYSVTLDGACTPELQEFGFYKLLGITSFKLQTK